MSKKTDREREEISEDDVQELAAIVEIPDMFQSIMTHLSAPDVYVGFAPLKSRGWGVRPNASLFFGWVARQALYRSFMHLPQGR